MTGAGVVEEFHALQAGAGVVDRTGAGVVTVTGPDARSFLDAIVSQSLAGLGDGDGVQSLLLQPTGKLVVDFRALVVGGDFWLDTEPGFGGTLAGGLSRYLLRTKAEIADRTGDLGVVSVRGERSAAVVADALEVAVPDAQHAHVAAGGLRVVRADWPDRPGVDLVGPVGELADRSAAIEAAGGTSVGGDAFEAARIQAGVPRLGVDLDEKVIPQEAFLDVTAVSFDKGCFLGQELVCRIHDRGHVNRQLRRLTSSSPDVPAGAHLFDGDQAVGELTSAVLPPGGHGVVALGYVRRTVEPGSDLVARWDGGEAGVTVEPPPPGA